jgi:hypothetical protein
MHLGLQWTQATIENRQDAAHVLIELGGGTQLGASRQSQFNLGSALVVEVFLAHGITQGQQDVGEVDGRKKGARVELPSGLVFHREDEDKSNWLAGLMFRGGIADLFHGQEFNQLLPRLNGRCWDCRNVNAHFFQRGVLGQQPSKELVGLHHTLVQI